MLSANEIRQQFLDFFQDKHDHTVVPSSSVVPWDDKTLLFANAGMNQFKDVFLGTGTRPYTRAVNTQKCIRAGGKHNDLDDVGKDTYHHTFFEMLGNWSFGDYFKKEAIAWAWELLTDVWGLDKSRLHATVFAGDTIEGLDADEEASELWQEVTDIDPAHIHRFGKKDNFWEMGDTGPCGPCSEIHYDRTPDKSGGKLVNKGVQEVIEIWNLVFIQFNRDGEGVLTPLPEKHVDTGMGFERITAVLQNKDSNYDTDVFVPLMDSISKITGKKYGGRLDDMVDTGFRVIADHLRMATFAITDGARPGNKERDSVLRSVIRRAVRFGYKIFNLRKPFLFKLVPVLVGQMGDAFPELRSDPTGVQDVLMAEEQDFLKTISRGTELFGKIVEFIKKVSKDFDQWRPKSAARILPLMEKLWESSADANIELAIPTEYESGDRYFAYRAFNRMIHFKKRTGIAISAQSMNRWHQSPDRIPGEVVFYFHSTLGFPWDLFQVMAEEEHLQIDLEWFQVLQKKHADDSKPETTRPSISAIKGDLPQTDDSPKYKNLTLKAKILGWVKDNLAGTSGQFEAGDELALLLDKTNFYGEQGGQVGDQGTIESPTGIFDVTDTQKLGDCVMHIGKVREGNIQNGQRVTLTLSDDRPHTMRNHTATHLLNWALRKVLGEHIEQKGSLVDAEKTRFDFVHKAPLTHDEIQELERLVNEQIYTDQEVIPVFMPLDDAKKIPGVRAVFGEKYPDPVRLLMIGAKKPEKVSEENPVEFCGGTHVQHTGEIGPFKIISQEAVGKGIRRVTAVTGRGALTAIQQQATLLEEAAGHINCQPHEVPDRITALQQEIKKLQQQVKKGAAADLQGAADNLFANATESEGAKIIIGEMPGGPAEQMRGQIDRLRQKAGSAVVVVGWQDDGKVGLIAAATDDVVKKGVHAGKIIGQIAKIVGGGGGGKPTMAQAGGKDPDKLTAALDKAKELVTEQMN